MDEIPIWNSTVAIKVERQIKIRGTYSDKRNFFGSDLHSFESDAEALAYLPRQNTDDSQQCLYHMPLAHFNVVRLVCYLISVYS